MTELVERVNRELAGFVGRDEAGLQFRPTTGDIEGVLQAIMPYLHGRKGALLPVGRHGSGVISLQTLLLLFEFGRARRRSNENFVLAAEEPELHLHPGHHRRLVSRIRATCSQSITTTHSPEIAAYYRPHEVLILRNRDGDLDALPLIPAGDSVPEKNALMRLYTVHRTEICEALMHRLVLLPEGITEYRWFNALFRLSATADLGENLAEHHQTLGVIPTQDSNIVPTYERFRDLVPELVPLVDGDQAGNDYVSNLKRHHSPPRLIMQLPTDAKVESLVAWMATPANQEEWECIQQATGRLPTCSVTCLAERLEQQKTNWRMHEEVVAAIAASGQCSDRIRKFFDGLVSVASTGDDGESGWCRDEERSTTSTQVWRWTF